MRHLSLFTGSGIGDLAAKAAGIITVAQCENDPVCQFALRRLWPDAKLFEDVRDVSAVTLARLGILPVDIISGGFPCQDISTAGRGAGIHGKQSSLWFEMRRVIGEVRPPWVLVENVPALRSRGADRVLADLEEEGYTCEANVVGAWAVGAPHKRDRVWIVAYRAWNGQREKPESERPDGKRIGAGGDEGLANATIGSNRSEARRNEVVGPNSSGPAGGACRSSALADTLGDLRGGGRDEPQRGVEGRTAVGRAGAAVADTEPDRLQGAESTGGQAAGMRRRLAECGSEDLADTPPGGLGTDGAARGGDGHADQRGAGLADTRIERRQQDAASPPGDEEANGRTGWEQCESHCDNQPASDGEGFRWPARPGEPQHPWEAPRLTQCGVGSPTDGLSARVHSRANKSLLRILGNAWVYPLAVEMFQAIVRLDEQ